ncbi:MAG: Chloroplast import component protein (Tic20) [Candidatus Aerophobetes bacterium ADurb.Bin490]|nr:MAG: Chloroplast import component protein (Tic20) [Candidatus Aerophobetes bacterium ADurb.Bin490]
MVLAFIPAVGPLLSPAISLGILALWVILMVKAFQKELFKLPVIGDLAEQQVK